MPISEATSKQSAIRGILLSTGLGALFGFQAWRMAKYGFAFSIPWYASAWTFLSNVLLGFSVGATTGSGRWWKRGLVLGLVFSLPSACVGYALGLRWAPYGVAVITAGLAAGLLLALIADSVSPCAPAAAIARPPATPRLSCAPNTKPEKCSGGPLRRRLAEEKVRLEEIKAERERRGDPGFGRNTEDRIVWAELLELELQNIDEQVNRFSRAAGESRAQDPRMSENSPKP